MSRIKEIKNRIKSVRDVQQITKAMKMVAAAKLRKIESRFNYISGYLELLEQRLYFVLKRNSWVKAELLKKREGDRKGYVILSGDKGLCGGFNMNIFKKTVQILQKQDNDKYQLMGVGKKAAALLRKEGYPFLFQENDVFGKLKYDRALQVSQKIVHAFTKGTVDEISLIYNRFKSKGDDESIPVLPLLPLHIPEMSIQTVSDYHYEPGVESFLKEFLPFYFSVKIYYYLLESEAAEFLARMTAMDTASDNAGDLINKLSLEYNRARQASITKEILEIVAGADALK